jgi:hypothetical protein
LLSALAEEGELETFAKAYGLFATVRPMNADFVRESVPAKISSRYLAGHRRLNTSKIVSWASHNPDWPDRRQRSRGRRYSRSQSTRWRAQSPTRRDDSNHRRR